MLSKNDLQARLQATDESRLLITPRWILESLNGAPRDLAELQSDRQKLNEVVLSRVTNNRIAVHLGPLLFTFRDRRDINKHKWSHAKSDGLIVDITGMHDGYPLLPNETVVAASSEYFEFPDDLAGILISRVGNHLSGISVNTTFVDAGWPGIVTFQVTNIDSETRLLRLGQEIARIFIFSLSSPQKGARERATQDGQHAGISWNLVLNGDRSPFEGARSPQRQASSPTSEQQVSESGVVAAIKERYNAACVAIGLPSNIPLWSATVLLVGWAGWHYGPSAVSALRTLTQFVERVHAVNALSAVSPERLTTTLTVRGGEVRERKTIALDHNRLADGQVPMVLVRKDVELESNEVTAVAGSVINQNRDIQIEVTLSNPATKDTPVSVELAVLWRQPARVTVRAEQQSE